MNTKEKTTRKRTKSVDIVTDKIVFERSNSDIHPHRDRDSLLETKKKVADEEAETGERGRQSECEVKAQSTARPSFLLALTRTFGVDFALQQLCKLVNTVLHMSDPLIFGYVFSDSSLYRWGDGVAQWLERRTRDSVTSNPELEPRQE